MVLFNDLECYSDHIVMVDCEEFQSVTILCRIGQAQCMNKHANVLTIMATHNDINS